MSNNFLKVLRLKENKVGRDFVTTDIHGMFTALKESLSNASFDKKKDRLFVVGDLVDRGSEPFDVLEFINEDWFFSVAGNHDLQYAFINDSEKFLPNHLACYSPNDIWWIKDEDKFSKICTAFREKLYSAIEIESDNGLIGLVHAEVPDGLTWTEMTEKLRDEDYDMLYKCAWNRTVAKIAMKGDFTLEVDLEYIIADVSHVFHGHTINKIDLFQPYSIGNRYYIDTCAYKGKRKDKYPNSTVSLFDVYNPNNLLI